MPAATPTRQKCLSMRCGKCEHTHAFTHEQPNILNLLHNQMEFSVHQVMSNVAFVRLQFQLSDIEFDLNWQRQIASTPPPLPLPRPTTNCKSTAILFSLSPHTDMCMCTVEYCLEPLIKSHLNQNINQILNFRF